MVSVVSDADYSEALWRAGTREITASGRFHPGSGTVWHIYSTIYTVCGVARSSFLRNQGRLSPCCVIAVVFMMRLAILYGFRLIRSTFELAIYWCDPNPWVYTVAHWYTIQITIPYKWMANKGWDLIYNVKFTDFLAAQSLCGEMRCIRSDQNIGTAWQQNVLWL